MLSKHLCRANFVNDFFKFGALSSSSWRGSVNWQMELCRSLITSWSEPPSHNLQFDMQLALGGVSTKLEPNMSKLHTRTNIISKTLLKAQRTRGLSSCHKFHTNLDQTPILDSQLSINFKISAKHQQSASRLNLNLASWSWPRFNFVSNLNQTSAAKYWPNFSFKISPEL